MDTNSEKNFEEILLRIMREQKSEDIIPGNYVKDKLDKELKRKRGGNSVFLRQISLYQSVAAAMIFFILGFGTHFLLSGSSPKYKYTDIEVVKKSNKPFADIAKQIDTLAEVRFIKDTIAQNPVINKAGNVQKTLLDKSYETGISLRDDTILKKMLSAIY